MSNVIQFPADHLATQAAPDSTAASDHEADALANTVTINLIQQALEDARKSKNWRVAKERINAAIKRGHLHVVK